MKIMKLLMCAAVALMTVVSCTPKKEAPKSKVLVLYYSLTSNTKTVAQEIATRLDADIEEITLVEPYDTAFQATIDRCKADREKGILPEIKPLKANIADYDWIFIGYPIWFGTYALERQVCSAVLHLRQRWTGVEREGFDRETAQCQNFARLRRACRPHECHAQGT